MFNYYSMSHQKPKVIQIENLKEAFNIANIDFNNCNSCCQVIIDEKSKIIYSLLESTYLSTDFKYKLKNKVYTVYNASAFSDIDDIVIIDLNYKPLNYKPLKYNNSFDCSLYA